MAKQMTQLSLVESLESRRLLAVASGIQEFRVDFEALNAAYGSTADGEATLTLDTTDEMLAKLRVQIDVTGLQDLTGIPGAIHVGHIHGQFAGNQDRSLAEQADGPFFEGAGGAPVDSVLPDVERDGTLNIDEVAEGLADDVYLDFFEGMPAYGPVVLNLGSDQLPSPPDGVPPLTQFFQLAGSGDIDPSELFPSGTTFQLDQTYTFDLSDPDQVRQFNNIAGPDGEQLDEREIVLHGLTIPTAISDAIDDATGAASGSPTAGVPLGNGMSFRATAPVVAGEIVAVAQDDSGIFRAGAGGIGEVSLPSIYIEREALFDNETGFFVTDADGSVNGIAPGEDGYAQAALSSSSRQVLFEAGSGVGAVGTPTVGADQNIVFYIVQDASTEEFLAQNPSNTIGIPGDRTVPLAFFSVNEANPDDQDHLRVNETEGGLLEFRWEDLTYLGDADFDDVVFPINVVPASEAPGENPGFETYAAVFDTLNDSGVTGVASITRDGDELTVTINAAGLEPNMPHAQHIHGLFEGDPTSEAREAKDSVTPPDSADTDGDGFVEVLEGVPFYGPIILPLTSPPINDNEMPISQSFPTAPDGTIRFSQTYDLGDESMFFGLLTRIDFNGDDALPLPLREIVLHGRSVSAGIGEGTDGEVDGTGGYLGVLPVAAGEIFSTTEISA